jgi:hypothetical protein
MASGDVVIKVLEIMPPAATAATPDLRAGGSPPAENLTIWDFDAATEEFLDYLCYLAGYDGGGLTITLVWSASSATTGDCLWGIAIRRINDDAEDIDGAHAYAYNSVTAPAPSASGEVSYDNVTFTDGVDIDSLANGEFFILRVKRDADNGVVDTMTGDAELLGFIGRES